MKLALIKPLFLTICIGLVSSVFSAEGQPIEARQVFDYHELKGLLLKHKPTIESMLAMKRFALSASKKRPESTIYIYKKYNDTTHIMVRIREGDGLASEVAWNEASSTLGNLTHDAVHDGFVPVNGNSKYQNRLQNMLLLVGYDYAKSETIPCSIRTTK